MDTIGKMADLKTDLQVRWAERFVSIICKTLVQLQQLNIEVISELYKSAVTNELNQREHSNKLVEENVKSFLISLLNQAPSNCTAENEEVPQSSTENVPVNMSASSPDQSNEDALSASSTINQRISLEKSPIHESSKRVLEREHEYENTNFSPRDHETSEELFPSSPAPYSKSDSSIKSVRTRVRDPVNELLSYFICSKDVAQNPPANLNESVEDSIPVYGALVEVETQSENGSKFNEDVQQSETSDSDRTPQEDASSYRSTSPFCEWMSSFPASYRRTPHLCPISESPFSKDNSRRKNLIQMRKKQRNMIAAKIRRNAKAYRENTLSVQLPFTESNPTESASVLTNSSENVSQSFLRDDNLNDVFIEQSTETGDTPKPADSQAPRTSDSLSLQNWNTSETRKEADSQNESAPKDIPTCSVEVARSQHEPFNSTESLHLDIEDTEPSVLDPQERQNSSSIVLQLESQKNDSNGTRKEEVLQLETNLAEKTNEAGNADSTVDSQETQYSSSITLQLESQQGSRAEKNDCQDVRSGLVEELRLESENNFAENPALSSSSLGEDAILSRTGNDSRAETSASDNQDAQSSCSFDELKLEIEDDSLEGDEDEASVVDSQIQNPQETVPDHVQSAVSGEECGSKTAKRKRVEEEDDDENTQLVSDSDSIKRRRISNAPVPTSSEAGNPQQIFSCTPTKVEPAVHKKGTTNLAHCNSFRTEESASPKGDSVQNETTDFVYSTMTNYCIAQDAENRSDEVVCTKGDLWVLLYPESIKGIELLKFNDLSQSVSTKNISIDDGKGNFRKDEDVSQSMLVRQKISRPRRTTRRNVSYKEKKAEVTFLKRKIRR